MGNIGRISHDDSNGGMGMTYYEELLEDEIRVEAYEIYVNSGSVKGRDLDNWLEAENIVSSGREERISHVEDEVWYGMPFEGSDC